METERYEPELDVSKVKIGISQTRMAIPHEALVELATSIRVQGLIEPIIVFEVPGKSDEYEVIAGQRRLMAVTQILNLPTIKAMVVPAPADEVTAKALSLTENLMRTDPSRADTIDVCTELYRHYGSVKLVAERTGLPERTVKEYVKVARLVPPLQELVKQGLSVQTALRAQDAATDPDGHTDEEEAIVLAKELGNMSGVQQKDVVQKRQENPDADVDELIESAKTGSRIVQILVTMSGGAHAALKVYAKEEGTTLDDAARGLIESGLQSRGVSVGDSE